MKKTLHLIYLISVSLLIFGCLLAVRKGFDILKVMETTSGTLFLFLLLVSTFVVMFFSKKANAKSKVTKTGPENIQLENFKVEKQLIETVLDGLVNKDDEKMKVSYTIEDKAIITKLAIKEINGLRIKDYIEDLKLNIERSLDEKFGAKEKFELKFEVEENKEKVKTKENNKDEENKENKETNETKEKE